MAGFFLKGVAARPNPVLVGWKYSSTRPVQKWAKELSFNQG